MRGYTHSVESSMSEAELRARTLTDQMARGAAVILRRPRRNRARTPRNRRPGAARSKTCAPNSPMSAAKSRAHGQPDEPRAGILGRTAQPSHARRRRIRGRAGPPARRSQRIPEATRQSSDAMRRALSEQLRALDQLSTLSSAKRVSTTYAHPRPQRGSIPALADLRTPERGPWCSRAGRSTADPADTVCGPSPAPAKPRRSSGRSTTAPLVARRSSRARLRRWRQ